MTVESFNAEFFVWCKDQDIDPYPMHATSLRRLYKRFESEWDQMTPGDQWELQIRVRILWFAEMTH